MNEKIKMILNKLVSAGYDAYVIGGFIRDYILGNENYDVDIATNATPKDIYDIFDLSSSSDENYGSVYFKDKLYNYDITTYRKEYKYENRKPVEYEFALDINDDLDRRDFTINAIYMDIEGNMYDPLKGREDIENRTIRCIGNIDKKMKEDPLRILRAIRFASLLNFDLEQDLYDYIKANKELINTLSFTRRKEELEKIFKNQNKLNGIRLIKELDLEDILEIKVPNDICYTENPLGIWAQLSYSDNYSFTNSEIEKINNLKKILSYAIIDNVVLYRYGLYLSVIAGEILGINRSYISDVYANMPIYSNKDIVVNGDDIIEIVGVEPGSIVKDILVDIELNILNNKLKNDKKEIEEYLIKHWR